MKHVAYAPDDKYTNQAVVSMKSVFLHNTDVEFIILYSTLTEESMQKLKSVGAPIRFIKVDENVFQGLTLSSWVTVQAWFRIMLPDLCPDLSKILYLDCDTLVLNDLTELFDKDLTDKYFAGVKDVWGVSKYVQRLQLKSNLYVNSGMLLLNCDYCRQEKFFEKVMEFAKNNSKIIEFCDQDSINKIADEHVLQLSTKYNYMDTWWRGGYYEYDGLEETDYTEAAKSPIIIHMTGPKPLYKECKNKFKNEWWDVAKQTSIYDILQKDYDNSPKPKRANSFLEEIFSIKNEYHGKNKNKILRIMGIKIKLK